MPLSSNSAQAILLGPATTIGQSQDFDANLYDTVIIACPGLQSLESGTVYVVTPAGQAITPSLNLTGGAGLGAAAQALQFPGRCVLRIITGATSSPVPIYVIPGPAKT